MCAMRETVVVVFVIVTVLITTTISAGNQDQEPELHEWMNFITKVEQDCINKTGISHAIIERTKLTLEMPDDDEQYKAYISCFYKKQGYQNEDGDIVFYNIKNMVTDLANDTVAGVVVNGCKNLPKGPSHEDYAYRVAKCLLENSKKPVGHSHT